MFPPPRPPQSLFERQGLPGPEKLPGSLRKGIPRTKSVGMAGLRDCMRLGGMGLGWVDSGLEDAVSSHPWLGFPVPGVQPLPAQPKGPIYGHKYVCPSLSPGTGSWKRFLPWSGAHWVHHFLSTGHHPPTTGCCCSVSCALGAPNSCPLPPLLHHLCLPLAPVSLSPNQLSLVLAAPL